ncbi:MAG: hypothetical protein ACTSXY_02075 [Promethearchaeota archaeon]
MIELKTLKQLPEKIEKKELLIVLKNWLYVFETEPKNFYEENETLMKFGNNGDFKSIENWLKFFIGE